METTTSPQTVIDVLQCNTTSNVGIVARAVAGIVPTGMTKTRTLDSTPTHGFTALKLMFIFRNYSAFAKADSKQHNL